MNRKHSCSFLSFSCFLPFFFRFLFPSSSLSSLPWALFIGPPIRVLPSAFCPPIKFARPSAAGKGHSNSLVHVFCMFAFRIRLSPLASSFPFAVASCLVLFFLLFYLSLPCSARIALFFF